MDVDADRLPAARPGPQLRARPGRRGCARALELDVVDVTKISRMLEQARETRPVPSSAGVAGGPARFARDAAEFQVVRP